MKCESTIMQLVVMVIAVSLLIPSGMARAQAVYGDGEDGPEVHTPPGFSILGVGTVDNGDFELGNLSGWGLYHAGDTMGWSVYSGTTSPLTGLPISAPPEGTYAATTDQDGPNVQILYQDITLSGFYELHFIWYCENWAGFYYTPDSLCYDCDYPNQHYRADIMDPSADLLSVAPTDIYLNIFKTMPGDPPSIPPMPVDVDLSPWVGQTVRLRFAEVDNQLNFNGSVDDIWLEPILIEVPVDIKPGSCPNPVNVKSKGVLPVAILGTDMLDVTQVAVDSISLEGVYPLRWALKDVGTPYEPYLGREGAYDCTTSGPDGYMDLILHFDMQEIVAALGNVTSGQVLVMELMGEMLDGIPIKGEDVVVIISKILTDNVLVLGDDDFEEIPLGFPFLFQGQEYTSVFVNSNGSLSFGAGSSSFWPTVSGFLGGPPRIAALWIDLNPNAGGQVAIQEKKNSMTISFTGVPEYPSTGSNTFSITIKKGGNVDMAYGAISALAGLVGVTEGNGASDPGETDLSEEKVLPVNGTIYELFTGVVGDSVDVADLTIKVRPQ